MVIGANSIEIMCPGSSIYCLMVYSMAGLICAPILLSELFAEIQNKVRGKFINIWQWVLILTIMCHFELCVAGEWQLYVQLLYNKNRQFRISGACYRI